jgi:hypothetical protein
VQLIGLGHETHYHERRSQTLKLGRGAFTQMLERYRGKLRKAALAHKHPGPRLIGVARCLGIIAWSLLIYPPGCAALSRQERLSDNSNSALVLQSPVSANLLSFGQPSSEGRRFGGLIAVTSDSLSPYTTFGLRLWRAQDGHSHRPPRCSSQPVATASATLLESEPQSN